MRTATLPHRNPESDFDAVITNESHRRARVRLQGLRARVFNAYAAYEVRAPNLAGLSPIVLSTSEHAALLACYQRKIKPRQEIRVAVLNAQATDTCPYCGLDTAFTCDHYLGKERHPEFAILHRNLVPSCSICNRPRQLIDRNGRRRILHYYYDQIENVPQLLYCTVRRPDVIEFEVHDPGRSRLGQLYIRHCEALGLMERYRRASVGWLGSFASEISASAIDDEFKLCAYYRRVATNEERRLGPNDPYVAFLRGAARVDCVRYLLGR